jgi:hypothetical protein
MAGHGLTGLVAALLVATAVPSAGVPTVATADGRLVVAAAAYRAVFADGTADIALDLRRADGAWEPVTTTPGGLAFGMLSEAGVSTTNGLPVAWMQAPVGTAVAVAGRVALDPLGAAFLTLHVLCADDGLLVGVQLEGGDGSQGSLWSPPRLTLAPGAWDSYAFWSQDGQYHAGRIASLEPTPAYAGVSPWEQQGETSPALAAEHPGLIVRSTTSGCGLGVVLVDAAGAWKGSSSFLQRHHPSALYFYTGYTPLPAAMNGLRWAWLAPFPAGDAAADAARVEALLAQAAGLLAAYRPLAPALAAGAKPLPDFPAHLQRTTPVAEIGEAVIYTINEGTSLAYGLNLARKTGTEVMIRGWFKWNQAPPVARLTALPQQAHGFGALFGGGITCSALYDHENGITPEQLREMATRGPDGALVDAWDQPGVRHGSLSSPAYLDYLLRWCREQIDAGVDTLFMDEHNAALSDKEGYDDASLRDFRTFLLEVSPATREWTDADPRWQASFGIDVADRAVCPAGSMASFDYRAYLKAGGHLEQPTVAENPLAGAWGDFRAWRDDRAWKTLTERIRAYAAEQGRRVLISANGIAPYVDLQVLGVWGQWTTRDGHVDLSEDLVPYWRALVVRGRQVAGDRPVPVVLFHDWGFGEPPFPWLAVPAAEREVWMRTRGAEIYAAGAFFAFPVLGPFGCDAGRDGTAAAIARQTAFYATHRDLYLRSRWLGRDGLTTTTPNLSLAATWSAAPPTLSVHVINRDVRAGVLRAAPGPVRLRVPLAQAPLAAVGVSPDAEGEFPVACRRLGEGVEVTLPELQAYTVVRLHYAEPPDLSGLTDPARLWPAKLWARPPRADFRVLPGGQVEPGAALGGYLQGKLHTHLRNPPVFTLNAVGPAELRLRLRAVATAGATLSVRIDDAAAQTLELPDLDGTNRDAPEYDRTVAFPIPAGKHRVALDNVGGDWLTVDWLEFAGTFADPESGAVAPTWEVRSVRKVEDRLRIVTEGLTTVVEITCPSGIGAAEIALPRRPEPGAVRIRLRYAADRAFQRLEGFEATLGAGPAAAKLEPHRAQVGGSVEVSLTLPADAETLHLSWVDAYR